MIRVTEKNIFIMQTKTMSYIFCYKDFLRSLYWGKKLHGEDYTYLMNERGHSSFDKDINRERVEFDFWSGDVYVETCLKVDFGDRRKLDMRYVDYQVGKKDENIESLTINFKNSFSDLTVSLHYEVYYENDVISRFATIQNNGDKILIENMKSASVTLPEMPKYHLRYLTGKWAGEFQVKDINLNVGAFTMQSKRGSTGPHFNPVFAIDDGYSTETKGDVFYGMLAYSGNWKITMEKTIFNNVRVIGGISDFDFSYELATGESFTMPAFVFGFAENGYGDMSRKLHDYQRDYILPVKKAGRVLYNSWEATAFDVNVVEQKALADKAAQMGVELFVIDDGWFGERHSDRAGLGDWYVNKTKFPNGLSELTSYVKGLGMDFGIWVEPEAVNPDSDLYRKHPDWIYSTKELEPLQLRNQYVLNISRADVKAFILQFMTELLSENPDISFIKWDMNRSISDLSMGDSKKDKELWFKHVEALYHIWKTLTEKFPNVEFETCSGGGARIDLGILRYANECWPSDNTDAFDRLFIQEGFSYFYNAKIMMCWVTETNENAHKYIRPDSYKFHSSMMGGLGIGANISKFDDASVQIYKGHIAKYKEIRDTVQFGDQYRLLSPRESNLSAVQYINKNGKDIVIFVFLHGQKYGDFNPNVRLQGLEPDALYQVNDLRLHGSTLMNAGLAVDLFGDFDSTLIQITKLNE